MNEFARKSLLKYCRPVEETAPEKCPECGEAFDENRMCSHWRSVAIPPQDLIDTPEKVIGE